MQRILLYGLLLLLSLFPLRATDLSPLARGTLALGFQEWKQHETEHFTLHYASDSIGQSTAVEAEYYYRFITTELEFSSRLGARRGHLLLFESLEAWGRFSQAIELEGWTGAITVRREVYLPRYPGGRFKGNALAHEMVHLIVNCHYDVRLPLWLSEGYAEEVSSRAYSTFIRSRGYRARPRVIPVAQPFTLDELFAFTHYPEGERIGDFYNQSRQLVRFLYHEGGKKDFARFFRLMCEGESFEKALGRVYFGKWSTPRALETAFMEKLVIGNSPGMEPRPERDE